RAGQQRGARRRLPYDHPYSRSTMSPSYHAWARVLMLLIAAMGPTLSAASQISVRSPLSDDRNVLPGTTYEGAILVHNETARVQEAKVYQTDYRFHSDGTNEYGEPGTSDRSNAGWIRLAPYRVMLPPGETVPVHYSVAVPAQEVGELQGSYWSMVMVEAIPAESPESTLSADSLDRKYGVRQIMRYGIQIATHLPDESDARIDREEAGLSSDPDHGAVLEFTLTNTGSRLLQPEVWVDLYDLDGKPQGRMNGSTNRIYPDTGVRQRISLGRPPAGKYRALVFVDAGEQGVFGAEYDLEIDIG
ncbi:MAG: hypothetical protein R3178_10775, partial [Rhodothermales bacterium]|nr:hypothetical protein [Rhodothermales bacterium]